MFSAVTNRAIHGYIALRRAMPFSKTTSTIWGLIPLPCFSVAYWDDSGLSVDVGLESCLIGTFFTESLPF
jgi:hypothetical protein